MLTFEQRRKQSSRHNLRRKRHREAIRRNYHDNQGRFKKGNQERKGAILSKETKDKIAERLENRSLTNEHKKNIIKGMAEWWENRKAVKNITTPKGGSNV
jgi:hypothetical protein